MNPLGLLDILYIAYQPMSCCEASIACEIVELYPHDGHLQVK